MSALGQTGGRTDAEAPEDARSNRTRRSWVLGAGASYAVDTVFLGLFAAAGTIPGSAAIAYGAVAAAATCFFYFVVGRGARRALRDPGLVIPQAFIGMLLQVMVPLMAPQITFPYLVNLLTVFAFVMIWLPLGTSVALWLAATALSGALFAMLGARVGVPSASPFELTLAWLYFSLVLGRCVFLSLYASTMRARLAASRERVQELATHDELTGLLNRRALMERLEHERARSARGGASFCVAVLDLDRFKGVNDTYGHLVGDAVLRRFADVVRATMREADVFGRHGGEEFMMIMVETQIEAATGALERVRAAVEAHDWNALAPRLKLTVSAGIAQFRPGGTTEEALRLADAALYEAKRAGRNKVCTA